MVHRSTEQRARTADLYARGFEPVHRSDWVLLVIAVADILLLLARDVYGRFFPEVVNESIYLVDLAIVGIFAIDFIYEAGRSSSWFRYSRSHWYEIVGLVPVAYWGFRMFRLVRLLRMYVVRRFPAEDDPTRSWNSALVRGVIGHYRNVLLEEITDPIVLASINQIEGPLVRARFAETLGETLDGRREHIHKVVTDAIRNTKGVSHVLGFQYGRDMVRNVTSSVLDTVVLTLESGELNEVISDSIRDVLGEVKDRVREKEYKVQGGTMLRPASPGS